MCPRLQIVREIHKHRHTHRRGRERPGVRHHLFSAPRLLGMPPAKLSPFTCSAFSEWEQVGSTSEHEFQINPESFRQMVISPVPGPIAQGFKDSMVTKVPLL